jgi:hypothetical protein
LRRRNADSRRRGRSLEIVITSVSEGSVFRRGSHTAEEQWRERFAQDDNSFEALD